MFNEIPPGASITLPPVIKDKKLKKLNSLEKKKQVLEQAITKLTSDDVIENSNLSPLAKTILAYIKDIIIILAILGIF